MRSVRHLPCPIGLALAAAPAIAIALGLGCREAGGVKPLQGSAGVAAATGGQRITLGAVLYNIVKGGIQRSNDNPQGRLAALEARRDDFISAVDAMVPPAVAGNLRGTLSDITRLVRDGTLPDLAENVARVLDLLADDPDDPQGQRLAALVSLGESRSALDRASVVKLAGRLLAYPELEPLLDSIAELVRANDGLTDQGAPTGFERDLVTELLGVLSRTLADLERPAPASGTSTQSPLIDTLLQPIQLRGLQVGGPAWAVRVDVHGNPKVARRSDGRLHFPFVDRNGDGAADVNASGEPVDATGRVVAIAPFGPGGPRDGFGRALADTGDPIYEYFDVKATPLGQAAHMLGDLIRADVPFELVKALDRLAPRTTRVDAQTGESFVAYDDRDNPMLDLAWAGLEVFRYRDAPKLLDAAAALIRNDPITAERLMVKLVDAIDILRNTPSNPSGSGAQRSVLDDLQPLLDRAFEVNSRTGQSAARLMLQTFSQEQARLRNLPQGFSRMMQYSDWMNRIPTAPGQKSMFERLLDMMAEANQCDSWPFGNMAMFYLEAMTGQKQILGITISVNTIHLLLDISFLRSLLCSRISEANVRALAAFSQSGALDALVPIVKAFHRAGELATLKDIFLALQSTYETVARPHEPALIRLLDSGAVELLFEVLDDMNRVLVPGTNEAVSLVVADFLEAMVDDDRTVLDRQGVRQKTLLHLLVRPLDAVLARAGNDPALSNALDQALDIALEVTVDGAGRRVLRNHGLIPLTASALESAADSMSIFPWVRNADITRFQQSAAKLFAGRDLPVLVDVVLAIERSPRSHVVKASIANLLTPNVSASHDVFASVLEVLAATLQQKADPTALVDLLRFAGRALQPRRGLAKPIAIGLVKLIDGPGGPTVLGVLQNGFDRGASGTAEAPIEIVLSVLDDVKAASTAAPQATTPASVRQGAIDAAEFIRDRQSGLGRVFDNLRQSGF